LRDADLITRVLELRAAHLSAQPEENHPVSDSLQLKNFRDWRFKKAPKRMGCI